MTTFNDSESGASVRTKINAAITTVDGLGSGDNLLLTAAERAAIAANSAKTTNATHTGDVTGSTALTIANEAVTIGKIASAAKSGSDATLITGTAGTSGNAAIWNGDGDLVDGPAVVSEGAVSAKATPVAADRIIGFNSEASEAYCTYTYAQLATDTTNVTAAGALMDSEVTNLADVKAFDPADYATAAQGGTADSALQDVVDDTTPTLGGDLDGGGNEIANYTNAVVTSVTGTLTTAAHSGNVIVTSGNVTVPTTAGFSCIIIAGGAHTVTFNSLTSAAMAAGDVMTVAVQSGTVIKAVLTAAADLVSFS